MAVHNESSFVLAYFRWWCLSKQRSKQMHSIQGLCLVRDDWVLPSYSVCCFCLCFVSSLSNLGGEVPGGVRSCGSG